MLVIPAALPVNLVSQTLVFDTEGQWLVYVDNPDTSREAGDVTVLRVFGPGSHASRDLNSGRTGREEECGNRRLGAPL